MTAVQGHFDRHARTALVAACGLLLLCWGGFAMGVQALRIYLEKKPVELRASLNTISPRIGPWVATGKDQVMDEAMVEELGTNKYLDRAYLLEGVPRRTMLQVHMAYYTGMIDAVPHVPDRCMVANGFNIKRRPENLPLAIDTSRWQTDPLLVNKATGLPYPFVDVKHEFTNRMMRIAMPLGDFAIRTTEFEREGQLNLKVFAGYFFIANGRVTPTPTDVRMLAFRPSEKYAYYCKVQFFYYGEDATQEKFLSLCSGFVGDCLPELMQKLPDWPEVERRGDQPALPVVKK